MIYEIISFINQLSSGSILLLSIIGLFIYFLPTIIQSNYTKFSLGTFIINIFFGRTPLPYLLIILNIIEYNEGTHQILKNQNEILEILRGRIKAPINFNQNKEQTGNHNIIGKSFYHRTTNTNITKKIHSTSK